MYELLLAALVVFAGQVSASAVKLSGPTQLTALDKLKGEPIQLAWSPDGSQFYLQTADRDGNMMVTNPRSFVVNASDGKLQPVAAEPDWASQYWTWKSGKSAPGHDSWAIEIKQEQRQATATASPMGGSLARGATNPGQGGTTVDDVTNRAQQLQEQRVISLNLAGETIGEFVNTQFLPGYTFGWSPQSLGLVAYGNAQGHLAVMDAQGKKQQAEGTKGVLLPAWSSDGSKIAYLQKDGKNKYSLNVVTVSQ